jgi:hypothetical protein
MKLPIDGPIDATKLTDRVLNIVPDVLRLKGVIAHALDQCFDHFRTFQASVDALVTDHLVIPIEQCMDPDNSHVFGGDAIAVGDLADFLGDVWRVDDRLPGALQEAERDHGEIRHVSEPGRATQHMGGTVISVPNGGILGHLDSR